MIQITLGGRRTVDPAVDPLKRDHVGWSEEMSEQELYTANRGCWVLGARADRERYVIISAQNQIHQAIEITAIVQAGNRRAIEGEILAAGHPVYDAYVGKPPPVHPVRNPITYVETKYDVRLCACDCGDQVTLGRFLPGHDQKALHERVAKIGTVYDFITWFDKTYINET